MFNLKSSQNQQINEYLQRNLRSALFLSRLGWIFPQARRLSRAVLANASSWADLLLDITGIRKTYRKIVCPSCGNFKSNKLDIEAVNKIGMCLNCDHLLTDFNPKMEVDPEPYECC